MHIIPWTRTVVGPDEIIVAFLDLFAVAERDREL